MRGSTTEIPRRFHSLSTLHHGVRIEYQVILFYAQRSIHTLDGKMNIMSGTCKTKRLSLNNFESKLSEPVMMMVEYCQNRKRLHLETKNSPKVDTENISY